MRLWVGATELEAEIATTPDQVRRGMMQRTEMGEGEAMLFVFASPHRASFWMKNTVLPLSCAYISPEGSILEIHDMQPLNETPIVANSERVQYVLEVNQGWFTRHQVRPGMLLRTERGSLSETFFGRP
jgi:hypothetical protein